MCQAKSRAGSLGKEPAELWETGWSLSSPPMNMGAHYVTRAVPHPREGMCLSSGPGWVVHLFAKAFSFVRIRIGDAADDAAPRVLLPVPCMECGDMQVPQNGRELWVRRALLCPFV